MKYRNAIPFLLALLLLAAILERFSKIARAEETLRAENSTQFFVEPNTPNDFLFSGSPEKPVPYRLLTEKEVVLSDGKTRFENGKHGLRVLVPPGYHVIDFPESAQRFGVVALPAFPKERRDPFFCIDAAFSWLVGDDNRRDDYVKIANRIGLAVMRERLSWSAINKKEGEFEWEGDRRYDRIRQTIKANGLGVLEVWHDTPGWVGFGGVDGKSGKLPGNLIQTADAWKKIAEHWQPTWAALEIWNEPDIMFSGDMPGDQYAPLVNAIAYRFKTDGIALPLVGASLATFNRTWLDTAINSGLLDGIDGFSFHTYAQAPAVENLYLGLSEMVHGERPDLTFWLTECGRPWRRGTGRPPRDQDIVSACDIIMKGVEAKASVVDYYYPFVFPYYDENDNNFAMMDRSGSPLRSMGAYAQMVRMLSGFEYVDYDCANTVDVLDGPAPIRSRAFENRDETIMILYTGNTTQSTTIRPKSGALQFLEAESLTGEPVSVAKNGVLTFQDGLVYLRIRSGKLRSPDTATTTPSGRRRAWREQRMREIKENRDDNANKEIAGPRVSPIIAVYRFDPSLVVPGRNGYHVNKVLSEPLPLRVRIYNLDDKPHRVVGYVAPENNAILQSRDGKNTLEIPANGFVEQTLRADIAEELAKNVHVKIRFAYFTESEENPVPENPEWKRAPCRLQLVFSGEPEWKKVVAAHPEALRLPIEKEEFWRKNVGAQGKLEMDFAPESNSLLDDARPTWSFRVAFGEGDRWVYPVFSVPKEVDFARYKGIILRARCTQGATNPRLMLYETEQGSGYVTSGFAFIADGNWHTAVIPFDSLEYVGATPPDPNGRLDPDRVRSFSIGANTQETELQIDVADCLLYR